MKPVTVLLCKEMGRKSECENYTGISLLGIVAKVYGGIVNDHVKKISETLVGEEQGWFRKGGGCVDQIS